MTLHHQIAADDEDPSTTVFSVAIASAAADLETATASASLQSTPLSKMKTIQSSSRQASNHEDDASNPEDDDEQPEARGTENYNYKGLDSADDDGCLTTATQDWRQRDKEELLIQSTALRRREMQSAELKAQQIVHRNSNSDSPSFLEED
ncbi:hypothetical protein LINGRAHAP2_LOCUS8243 [Linum grandiflorum]